MTHPLSGLGSPDLLEAPITAVRLGLPDLLDTAFPPSTLHASPFFATKIGVVSANRLLSRLTRLGIFLRECGMLFRLEDVTKTYGAVTALNDLSVSVPMGAIGLFGA